MVAKIMIKRSRLKGCTTIIMAFALLAFAVSCKQPVFNTSTTTAVLTTTSIDIITSTTPTIFKELQNRVPFQIVIPSYLPDDIKDRTPLIQGPWADFPSENITSLRITYGKGGEPPKTIIINEHNSPTSNVLGKIYFEINGIQIYEDPFEMAALDGSQILHGLDYNWNLNNVHVEVGIVGYEKLECRKIVGSMIK